MGIRTVMVTGDNRLTAAAIAAEAGVDDFIAEATPEDKLAYIRKAQAEGRLVAMAGDGTNDAPALAQADVGLAMQTGTQAAREAGNMVDLDSDPTKLIEVVEIGKQLLITRGALTTFSVANDVAKDFAIIPAMLLGSFPVIAPLNALYREVWGPLHNFFLPSAKLEKKSREGAKVRRQHDKPRTPCERLLESPHIRLGQKRALRKMRAELDPFELHDRLEQGLRRTLALARCSSRPTASFRFALPQEARKSPRRRREF
jgi:hypothetical protein